MRYVVEQHAQGHKQVVVIGGGVVGICTAYFLAAAGHQVAVLERHASVAEGASFGHAGAITPALLEPQPLPDQNASRLGALLRVPAGRERRRWRAEVEPERWRLNRDRMQRLAAYSRAMLQDTVERHKIDYERSTGLLQLLRTERDVARNAPLRERLAREAVPHQLLDAAAARALEPGLASDTPLAAALHLPDSEAGNCALFAKQLRQVAQHMGVQFHFQAQVEAIRPDHGGVDLQVGEASVRADAVVLAAGIDSATLLRPLGIELPLVPVRGYSITLPIHALEAAPLALLSDEARRLTITRLGTRLRIAGLSEPGMPEDSGSDAREQALQTLIAAGRDWFPGAASYRAAQLWCGVRPTLADGPPLLGATRQPNLYLNLGHGGAGWAMAAGSGKIVADLLSGHAADIDLDGLTLERHG